MAKSQKRTKSNNNSKKKLPWVSIQMYRVSLNPEQAVLTCCNQPVRGAAMGTIGQCVYTPASHPCEAASGWHDVSS